MTHLCDLFLLLPDVANNLQDALGIGQPGHIFWQSLQLRHLGRNMAGMNASPTLHPTLITQGLKMGLTSCL